MSYGVGLPSSAGLRQAQKRSRALFHWRAQDGGLLALSGHTPALTRAGRGGAVRGYLGKIAEQYGQHKPRLTMVDRFSPGGQPDVVGMLFETGISNSILRSEDFSNASWTKTRASVALATTLLAPRRSFEAYKLTEDATAANTHFVQQGGITITAAEYVELSFFVKAGERTRIVAQAGAGSDYVQGDFNLSTGVASGSVGGTSALAGCSMKLYGDGWWRCHLAGKINAASTAATVNLFLHNGTATSYNGDGASGLYLFGAQFLRGGTAGAPGALSYLGPTAGAALSRANEFLNYANAAPPPELNDLTLYFQVERPPWADWTGPLANYGRLLRIGTTTGAYIQVYASATTPNIWACEVSDGTTASSRGATIASGALVEACFRVRNILTGGTVDADCGSGFVGYSGTPAGAFNTFGNQTLAVGSNGGSAPFDGVILCAKVAAGLRDMQQMRELL